MSFQVLISTMNQKSPKNILKKMNVKTGAIIINQSADFGYNRSKLTNGSIVHFFTFAERGVGLSRNMALMRADSDIALFADDDVVYNDDYESLVKSEFNNHPYADAILFNVPSNNPNRPEYEIKKFERLHIYNCLRYGTFRLAVRVESVKKANIYFSLLFGGGARYSSGEDSLFISDCIKSGLNVYASPVTIGEVNHEVSTWFNGYTDKFFIDKGAFFKIFAGKLSCFMIIQYAVRKYKLYQGSKKLLEACTLMHKGSKQVK